MRARRDEPRIFFGHQTALDEANESVVERLQDQGVWTPVDITGPAPYLPEGYGGTPPVGCYYLTARVRPYQ